MLLCYELIITEPIALILTHSATSPSAKNNALRRKIIDIVNDETGLWFQTKGDNNNIPDREFVESSAVVGIYVFRIPYIANI